jgi:hypothetical protein
MHSRSGPGHSAPTASDSLGLDAVNRALGLLPIGSLTNSLTLGELKRVVPPYDVNVVGIMSRILGSRSRSDSIMIDYAFESDSGDIFGWTVTDGARTDQISAHASDSDIAHYARNANLLLSALATAPVAPSCLTPTKDVTSDTLIFRMRRAAWYADGWIAIMSISANRYRGDQKFHFSYRAERFDSLFREGNLPIRQSRDCLPRLAEVIEPFLADSASRKSP